MLKMEEHAIVLDFLPQGRANDPKREPLAQSIGDTFFTLLELIPKPGLVLTVGEKVYIGKDAREKIDHIKRRIEFKELTSSAQAELPVAIKTVIDGREKDFVDFFNKAGAITLRLHRLELLPGIGKKHLTRILAEREKKPFESFADISARVELMPSPHKLITDEIMTELQGTTKYYLFCKPPFQEREGEERFRHGRRFP